MPISKVYDIGAFGLQQRLAAENIPQCSRVLEFGTATGHFTKFLLEEKGCSVTGYEFSEESAAIASQYTETMIVGDIEDQEHWAKLSPPYAAILFMDVLEHLREPQRVLSDCRSLLNEQGVVMISLPNIAHWTIRKNLILGRFDYTETGILDDTHVKFFTKSSLLKMIDMAGYDVKLLQLVNADPLAMWRGMRAASSKTPRSVPAPTGSVGFLRRLRGGLIAIINRLSADALVFQFFVICTPKKGSQ